LHTEASFEDRIHPNLRDNRNPSIFLSDSTTPCQPDWETSQAVNEQNRSALPDGLGKPYHTNDLQEAPGQISPKRGPRTKPLVHNASQARYITAYEGKTPGEHLWNNNGRSEHSHQESSSSQETSNIDSFGMIGAHLSEDNSFANADSDESFLANSSPDKQTSQFLTVLLSRHGESDHSLERLGDYAGSQTIEPSEPKSSASYSEAGGSSVGGGKYECSICSNGCQSKGSLT
jgi:hypothetical protein